MRICADFFITIHSGVIMGGTGAARGRHGGGGGGNTGALAPPPPPIQNFDKIGPHLRLQDTTCSSIDMPPRKSGAPPSVPLKIGP